MIKSVTIEPVGYFSRKEYEQHAAQIGEMRHSEEQKRKGQILYSIKEGNSNYLERKGTQDETTRIQAIQDRFAYDVTPILKRYENALNTNLYGCVMQVMEAIYKEHPTRQILDEL